MSSVVDDLCCLSNTSGNVSAGGLRSSPWRAGRVLLAGVLLGGAALLLGHLTRESWLPAVPRWLDVGSPPRPTDAVFVLPGDENRRPFVAAAIVKAGLARFVLIPETAPSNEMADDLQPPTHETIRGVLLARGVAPEHIRVLSGASQSTMADLAALDVYLAENGTARVAIVTSAFHTRRTRLAVHSRLGGHASRIQIVSAPNSMFYEHSWWQSEDGFVCVVSEYVKLGAYWVLHGSGGYWLLGIAGGAFVLILWRRRRRWGRDSGCSQVRS